MFCYIHERNTNFYEVANKPNALSLRQVCHLGKLISERMHVVHV